MSFAGDLRQVALSLCDLLDGERIGYAFMGGLAVPIWGIPRATFDIDVTISTDADGLSRLFAAAKALGFEIEPAFESGFRDKVSGMEKLRLDWWTQQSRRVEVDVFLVTTAYQAEAFRRRVRVKIEDRQAWVLGPADLILHELVAGRPKDLADVQNILAVQDVPDAAYLRAWSARLGVTGKLAEALRDAALR